MPAKGRGEFQRIAIALRMHTTSVSQVFRGTKDLSPEQGVLLCQHFGLTEIETDYLTNLIELARAGTAALKEVLGKRLVHLRLRAQDLSARLPKDRVLSESDKNRFYANWYHSAIRLLCDIPEYRNVDYISSRLRLPLRTVNETLAFLLSTGLCIEEEGTIKMGVKRTFIENTSPLISRHHANWRLKCIENLDRLDIERDLALTAPMTLSREDVAKIRAVLIDAIETVMRLNTPSPSEELHCLNIDWFKV